MKTLFIGDLHLKAQLILPLVEQVMATQQIDRLIFMGDYVDLHGQNINAKLYAKDLLYLQKWQQCQEKSGIEIINLLGNHDLYYLLGVPAEFSLINHDAFFAIQNFLENFQLRVAYQLDDYLVSHAGFNILFDLQPWHLEPLTRESIIEYEEELEILARAVGPIRGGGDMGGSPVWADFREMELMPNGDIPKQIVGHTPQESVKISDQLLGIDTFSVYFDEESKQYKFWGNGDLLCYEGGEFTVLSTDWQSEITKNALQQLVQN